MIALDTVEAGFKSPVFDSQAWFRVVLDALSRPGTIRRPKRGTGSVSPQRPFDAAAIAVALSLLDNSVQVWLAPSARTPRLISFLRFHTGATLCEAPGQADFALIPSASEMPPLSVFSWGSDETPEYSTTLLLQVAAISNRPGWLLRGPGIRDSIELDVEGMPTEFKAMWQDNHAAFPRGVDLLLVCGDRVCGLPRTTSIGH